MCRVIGSTTITSRQPAVVFPENDSDNTLLGFAEFVQGFSLESAKTTCTYEGIIPVSGTVRLNNGTLFLKRDLQFLNRFDFAGGGKIDGRSLTIKFPSLSTELAIPTSEPQIFAEIDQATMDVDVHGIDWSINNEYLVATSIGNSNAEELQMFYFDGITLTQTQAVEHDRSVHIVRWHPTDYYFAVGADPDSNDELLVYKFTPTSNQLIVSDSRSLGNRACFMTRWHPSGNYLIAGAGAGGDEILAYSFSPTTGLLTDLDSIGLVPSRSVSNGAISFRPDGHYFVVGLEDDDTIGVPEIKIYFFDGISLTLTASADIGHTIGDLNWSSDGKHIVLGLEGSAQENVRVFEFNSTTSVLLEKHEARIADGRSVGDIEWDATGAHIAVAYDSGIGSALVLYEFDQTTTTMIPRATNAYADSVGVVRYSRGGELLATGDEGGRVRILHLEDAETTFKDITLIFDSDVLITSPIYFEGFCQIKTNDRKVRFDQKGEFIVRPHSSLNVVNSVFKNFGKSAIRCLTPDGTINLKDSIFLMSQDYTFSQGSIEFDGDVIFSGTTTFHYTSVASSTITTRGRLIFDQGLVFSYAPATYRQDLLVFEESTAALVLKNSTLHTTSTGMSLTKGLLEIQGRSFLSNHGGSKKDGIILGDGVSLLNDIDMTIFPGANIELLSGFVVNKNVG